MAIRSIIFAVLMQCIVSCNPAFAVTGHTIKNGGGLGEIEFTGIWQKLAETLAPCTHAANLCGLSSAQLSALQIAIRLRPAEALGVVSEQLYRNGQVLSRVELTELAIATAIKCSGKLLAIDTHDLTVRALSFSHFSQFLDGHAVALSGKSNLVLLTPDATFDLTANLGEKVRFASGFTPIIVAVTTSQSAKGLQIFGSAMIDVSTRIHFQFLYRSGHLELAVLP